MSRLQRGQTAVGVLRRQEACKVTVQARIGVFAELENGDHEAAHFAEHFRSVAALCEWRCPQRQIEKVSIKTLRTHIKGLYEGGMEQFKQDIQQFNNRGGTEKPPTVKQLVGNRTDAVLQMVQRYDDLVDRISRVASASEPVSRALRAHFQKFGDLPGPDKSQVIYASFRKKSDD